MNRYVALVPAAGAGLRLGGDIPKQYLSLAGYPLLWHTLQALIASPLVERVAVVIAENDEWFETFDWPQEKLLVLRHGGATRALTVRQGMAALLAQHVLDEQDWLLVHDAARCCLSTTLLERLIAELASDPVGGLLALPVADTVKCADDEQRVARTVPRDSLWLAQTPQMFRVGLLKQAFAADGEGVCTDEASAVEALGLAPRLVPGNPLNFKVTYAQDLALAEVLIGSCIDRADL